MCVSDVCFHFLQVGGEERHPDRVHAEDFRPESRSEAAAQSTRHRAVRSAARCVCSHVCMCVCFCALQVCNVCVSAGRQSHWKDLVLGLSILMALGGCWFAYAQTRKSRDDLGKLMKDLESLQRAEQSLLDLQEK